MAGEILIVGLGAMGASIGLALQSAGVEAALIGFDADSQTARRARQAGCIQRLVHRPEQAASQAQLVVLTEPAVTGLERLSSLAPCLPKGAVILDASPLKLPGLAWAARSLPAGRHYVAILPIVAGTALLLEGEARDQPSADRFRNSPMAVCAPPGAAEEAIEASLSFAAALGAVPFFVDAAEADGVSALAEILPALLGASLMRVAIHRSGWHEVERLAGAPFARLVLQGAEATAKEVSGLASLNRVNVLSKLDAFLLELGELRQILAEGDERVLAERIRSANVSLQAWLATRQQGDWDRAKSPGEFPPRQGLFDRLFGFRPPTNPRP